MRKIKYDGRVYREAKASIIADLCPRIYPCQKCGYPVAEGFCCTHCMDSDPGKKAETV